jgi:hypothetical protein
MILQALHTGPSFQSGRLSVIYRTGRLPAIASRGRRWTATSASDELDKSTTWEILDHCWKVVDDNKLESSYGMHGYYS